MVYKIYEDVLDNAKITIDICNCKYFRLLVLLSEYKKKYRSMVI